MDKPVLMSTGRFSCLNASFFRDSFSNSTAPGYLRHIHTHTHACMKIWRKTCLVRGQWTAGRCSGCPHTLPRTYWETTQPVVPASRLTGYLLIWGTCLALSWLRHSSIASWLGNSHPKLSGASGAYWDGLASQTSPPVDGTYVASLVLNGLFEHEVCMVYCGISLCQLMFVWDKCRLCWSCVQHCATLMCHSYVCGKLLCNECSTLCPFSVDTPKSLHLGPSPWHANNLNSALKMVINCLFEGQYMG